MSRYRFIGGNNVKIVGGDYLMHSDESIEFNSFGKIYEDGKEGIFHSNFEERKETKTEFFIDGEWLDKDGKPFKKNQKEGEKLADARVGDKVYFRLKTKNLPTGTPITLELMEYDGSIFLPLLGGKMVEARPFDDKVPFYDTNDKGSNKVIGNVTSEGYITLGLELTELLDEFISEDNGATIELYFKCTYEGYEVDWLPKSTEKYLTVTYSDRTLFIQSAAGDNKYGLPEFRTSDGDILIFSGGVESIDKITSTENVEKEEEKTALDRLEDKIKDEVEGKIKDKIEEKVGEGLEKLQKTIAIHQLKKGKLGLNNGQIRTSKRLYTTTQFDNLGEEYSVTKASNFGYIKNGEKITSKGISQLDFFKETNVYSKIAKVGKNALDCLAFLDLAKYTSGNGDAPTMIIPSPIPALNFVIELMLAETNEQIKTMTEEAIQATLEAAKDLGVKGVEEFIRLNANDLSFTTGDIKDARIKRFASAEISLQTLHKILQGKVRNINAIQTSERELRLANINDYVASSKYLILYEWVNDDKINDYVTIINSIFVLN